ncbi:MAG: ThuA domain-containing protein [Burkholderiales bacterium]|jgi:type 1 glutamine amidotransferase|nr:ThuA domain-containing protein [Burkholderiales bacterium]
MPHLKFVPAFAMACLCWAAHADPVVDCPLKDAPFSVDSPVLDVYLNADAIAVVQKNWPGVRTVWPGLISTSVPSFGAIVTLRSITPTGFDALGRLDAELRALPVTDVDRRARCARYDNDMPQFDLGDKVNRPAVLVFEKMTGFRDGPSVTAALAAFKEMARRRGWTLVVSDKGGALTPAALKQFNVVIWNNVSGDVLTLSQRAAFKQYIENGGGFVGVHGSGGDPETFWPWYVDELIGARFGGHPGNPQFRDARINVADPSNAIVAGLGDGWTMNDEWYSFKNNPRRNGARILATLDEKSYSPPDHLVMGDDHPIAWTRCIGKGRSFYSAIGHRPETYSEPSHVRLLEQAIEWAAGKGLGGCQNG